jgi:hypothetical protein
MVDVVNIFNLILNVLLFVQLKGFMINYILNRYIYVCSMAKNLSTSE